MAKAIRARIQDVAEKAGVSTMTVSRVLRKDIKVSDEKTALVMAAVEALNYRPNVSARRLASSQSFFIGLLYFGLDTSYVSKFLLRGLKSCRATGHHLVADEIDDDIDRSITAVRELIDVTQVDGIILLPPVCDIPEVLDMLIEAEVPFVRIAPDTRLDLSPYICMDDYQAGFEITEHLIKQGHTKIGHIIGHPDQGAGRLRYKGYLDALQAHQIKVSQEFIEQGFFTYDSGCIAAAKMLEREDKPTAIFAANDEMAAAVISVAHMNQISVPDQLSVAGFDDGNLATMVTPNLTTVRQPIQEMAALAIELLASKKFVDESKKSSRGYRHVLDFEIVDRESSVRQSS